MGLREELIILFCIGVIIVGIVGYLEYKDNEIKEIELCEGVTIATINANSDLCYNGCILYEGEFVPYHTFKYLMEEVCVNSGDEVNEVGGSK